MRTLLTLLLHTLKTSVPLWVAVVGAVALSLAARYIAQPKEIVTHTRYQTVRKSYPVEKLVDRPVPVPYRVVEYRQNVVRDTTILVPTGLREWAVIGTVNHAPAIVINRREVVVPIFTQGVASEYRYRLPGERRFQITAGALFSALGNAPIVAGEVSYERVRATVGIVYQDGFGAFGHLRIGLLP